MGVHIPQAELLTKMLDVALLRHRVLADNIANINTPGYLRKYVTFEQSLARALSSSGNPYASKPAVLTDHATPGRVDGNNVDLDEEIGRLSKNALLYQLYMQILASRVATTRTAITGR
ncbi:MAG: flagellar basal body rod protein FlgB [Gemmataceae bacterium]